MSYTVLYILWGVMFAVTAALGFAPTPDQGMPTLIFQVITAAFFLPPWMILTKANREEKPKHRLIVRNLCLASIGSTVLLMVLNVLSANWSEAAGNALHAALTVISAPMVCGQTYILGLFLWGCLLMASNSKVNPRR